MTSTAERSSPSLRVSRRAADAGLLASTAALVLLVWELAVGLLEVPATILPPPTRILESLVHLITGGTLWTHLRVTTTEIVIGFLLGSVLGIVLGTLIALSGLLRKLLYPYIIVLQVIPKIAIAPLLVVWFGFGIQSKVVMAVLISFFPLLVNTIAGLQSVSAEYLDLMRSLLASRWQVFRYVRFPSALPFIFAGLETAMVLAVIGAIVGEFVGAGVGLGFLIMLKNANLDIPGVFAVLVVLAALGLVLHGIVALVGRRVVFWTSGSTGTGAAP